VDKKFIAFFHSLTLLQANQFISSLLIGPSKEHLIVGLEAEI